MHYEMKVGPQGHVYLPKELRKNLIGGKELEVHPNLRAGVMIPRGADPKEVVKSLDILRSHFEQLAESQKSGGE